MPSLICFAFWAVATSKVQAPQTAGNPNPKLQVRLEEAVYKRDRSLAKFLLKKGAKLDYLYKPQNVDGDAFSLLNQAIRQSDINEVKFLLSLGADYLKQIEPADSPTCGAYLGMTTGDLEMARLFMSQKRVTSKVLDDLGVMHNAAARDDIGFIEMFHKAGASVSYFGGIATDGNYTPLHYAAGAGAIRACRELISLGASVDKFGTYGPPIIDALENEHEEIVKLFVERGAKLTFVVNGDSLLAIAAEHFKYNPPKNPEVVARILSFLKEHGAR